MSLTLGQRNVLTAAAAVLAVAAGVVLALWSVGARPVRVTTGSMQPTIRAGEWAFVTDTGTVHRGDVVEFRYPTRSSGRAIKRVAAVAGDGVELTANAIVVNGHAVPLAGQPVDYELRTMTVPDGSVYLLGDNHAGSYDSRGFGPVPVTDIVGRYRATIPNPRAITLASAALTVAVLASAGVHRSRRPGPDPLPPAPRPATPSGGPGPEQLDQRRSEARV